MHTAHGSNGTTDPQQPAQGSEAAAPAPSRLLDDVEAIVEEWRGRVHDHLSLAALEARRAGENLVVILAYGTVVGVLLGGACLVTTAAIVVWLVALGVPNGLALLLGAVLMLLGAVGFAREIRRRSRTLQFPASLRSLKSSVKSVDSVAPKVETAT